MRWKTSAGALMALAFLIPAAPAVAQAAPPGLNAACQTVERKVYQDIRKLVTIDLDTATDDAIKGLARRIEDAATADLLPVLPRAMKERREVGTMAELREFLKKGMYSAWESDLRISTYRTLPDAGSHVKAAAEKVLSAGGIDVYLAYLNDGLYAARALDCAAKPPPPPAKPTPTPVKPSAPTTVAPTPAPSASAATPGGEGGALPVTGADTGTVAGIGGALLLLGGAGYLIGRRRRSRFVA